MNMQLATSAKSAITAVHSDSETEILQTLSFRQRQILWAICWGLTAREAGTMLEISPRTVEIHKSLVLRKMNARNCADAVRIAMTNGFDCLPEPWSKDLVA